VKRFTIAIDPVQPARVVLRTGGQAAYGFHETLTTPVTLRLLDATPSSARSRSHHPRQFAELAFELPRTHYTTRTRAYHRSERAVSRVSLVRAAAD